MLTQKKKLQVNIEKLTCYLCYVSLGEKHKTRMSRAVNSEPFHRLSSVSTIACFLPMKKTQLRSVHLAQICAFHMDPITDDP